MTSVVIMLTPMTFPFLSMGEVTRQQELDVHETAGSGIQRQCTPNELQKGRNAMAYNLNYFWSHRVYLKAGGGAGGGGRGTKAGGGSATQQHIQLIADTSDENIGKLYQEDYFRDFTDPKGDDVNHVADTKFNVIAQKLRQDKPLTPEEQAMVDRLNKALDKHPSYKGDSWRGIQYKNATDMMQAAYTMTPGAEITFKHHTSTSRSEKVVTRGEYAGKLGQSIVFKISGKKGGTVLSKVTGKDYEGEQEVLYRPKTKFRVTDRKMRTDGIVEVSLTEI